MPAPLRVLLASRVYHPNLGGIEKHVQWLGEHLVRRGHQVDVVTLDRAFEDGRALPPFERHGGVRVYRVPFVGSTRYPLAPRVARFVADYDLVHVHAVDFLADWLVFTRRWHGRPVVLSTHGGFFHTRCAAAAKRLWFHTMTRALFASVDALVYTSDQDAELFRRISDRGRLVRTGVETAPWLGLPPAPRHGSWVTVGRVDVHKGLGALLRTLAELRRRDPAPFTARVIGPEVVDGLVARLTEERDSLGLSAHVAFEGRLTDEALREALRTAELGLWPAEYESFGISVVEAMAAGVAPVLNDIAAFRHFDAPGASERVDFADPAAAAAAILRARDRVRAAPVATAAAARAVARRFSWEAVVGELEAVYREVVARRPRPRT